MLAVEVVFCLLVVAGGLADFILAGLALAARHARDHRTRHRHHDGGPGQGTRA